MDFKLDTTVSNPSNTSLFLSEKHSKPFRTSLPSYRCRSLAVSEFLLEGVAETTAGINWFQQVIFESSAETTVGINMFHSWNQRNNSDSVQWRCRYEER
ncbi:hypothetical protein L2E82_38920 [Cichorium intybus]|uniref:Uncharacterized protein n=1 Tax=Cichorium intybus TaxID=13427 RepID=A0ACB9AGS6_CICIN|nr:hypothetical protein L2E82_38920 [Cichorium intybus]